MAYSDKHTFTALGLITLASALLFMHELAYWTDWLNDIKAGKGMLWLVRLICVFFSSIGIKILIKDAENSESKIIKFLFKTGINISAMLLGFAWALLVVAFVGVFSLHTLILEGVGGACLLIVILYFIGKKAHKVKA